MEQIVIVRSLYYAMTIGMLCSALMGQFPLQASQAAIINEADGDHRSTVLCL